MHHIWLGPTRKESKASQSNASSLPRSRVLIKNSWTIIGNLGKDAQTAVTPGGKAVANLRVAVNEGRKDNDGVWHERTQWVRVECWASVYQYASRLRKGQKVLVEGRHRDESFTVDGKERTVSVLVARSILLLANSPDSEIEGVSINPEMTSAAEEGELVHEI